jgi:uncharacterized protein YdeI (YjbR/CyaY-like superfamily)
MKTLYVKNRNEWRTWLEKNSKSSEEIWLIYYKKASGKPRLAYEDAVGEALCFGWIDGKIRKLDEECYAQRFSPRKFGSHWSALNIKRVKRLIEAGSMTAAGLEAFTRHSARKTSPLPTGLPKDLKERFTIHVKAWGNFNRFPPYYRRMTIGWVASAKKQETKLKRLRQLISYSDQNRKIKFM